jgi:hypothetical protein
MKNDLTKAILAGGLSVGVLDFLGACISNASRGVTPVRIGQSVASGLIGARAFQGGYKTAALGVLLHFVIALCAATVYVLASRKIPMLTEQTILSGVLYGILVFWFMQLVVLPLSAIAFKQSFAVRTVVIGLIVHVLCVGLPIAIATRWSLK